MHSLAKIVLFVTALYLGIYFCRHLMFAVSSIFLLKGKDTAMFTSIAILLIIFLAIVSAIYLLIIKREKFAQKIVGSDLATEPDTQIPWVPFAFRLTVICTGFIALYKFIIISATIVRIVIMLRNRDVGLGQLYYSINQIAAWLILLPIAVYLLCGAPHFVKWHTKKTLELTKQ